MGEKCVWAQFYVDSSFLQGEMGLEGDSGPPGPDGAKVNFGMHGFYSREGILGQCSLTFFDG